MDLYMLDAISGMQKSSSMAADRCYINSTLTDLHEVIHTTALARAKTHRSKDVDETMEESTNPVEFKYRPLDSLRGEIRLIRVMPTADTNVHLQLQHTFLELSETATTNQHVGYTALSYMWGTESATETVLINDQPVSVRSNLYLFLQTLSKKVQWLAEDSPGQLHRYATLWIDSLCIDQDCTEERNHQVSFMKIIYTRADQVLVWIGEPDGNFEIADRNSPEYSILLYYSRLTQTNTNRAANQLISTMSRSDRFSYNRAQLNVDSICRKAYWNRLWIIQEICLASDVIFMMGDYYLGFDVWCDLLRIDPDPAAPSAGRGVSQWRWRLKQGDKNLQATLIRAIRSFGAQKCADKRDKLLGLLSLIEGGEHFPVDYSDSVEIIFWKALKHFRGRYGTYPDDDAVAAAFAIRSLFGMESIPNDTLLGVNYEISTTPLLLRLKIIEKDIQKWLTRFTKITICHCPACNQLQFLRDHLTWGTKASSLRHQICGLSTALEIVLLEAVPETGIDCWRFIALGFVPPQGGHLVMCSPPEFEHLEPIKIRRFVRPERGLRQDLSLTNNTVVSCTQDELTTSLKPDDFGKFMGTLQSQRLTFPEHTGAVWTSYKRDGNDWEAQPKVIRVL